MVDDNIKRGVEENREYTNNIKNNIKKESRENNKVDFVTKEADALFEVSWEVCNKVGGIYTVVMSKANVANSVYENYFLIGPYFHDKAIGEFEETLPDEQLRKVFDAMKGYGIICHYGKWLIKGEPRVILVDFQEFKKNTNEIKTRLWERFKIDSLNSPYDYDEPIVFSYATGMLIEHLVEVLDVKKPVAHFHEWMSGGGLLYLKSINSPIKTVFTTHATILGRSIAATTNLYEILDKINDIEECYKFHIQAKHLTEKACAQNADCFTTVSEITGLEAEHLLQRKPDILLPNGLDMTNFPSFEELTVKHREYKFRIKEFILYNFFPYYSFDLGETLIFFIFARYEFQNKGIDVFIEALSKLNEKMKKEGSRKTVVAFFFIPTSVKSIRYELIENKRFYEDVKESVENNAQAIKNNVLINLLSDKPLDKSLFPEEFLAEVKKKLMRFKRRSSKVSCCTHDIINMDQDPIINHLRKFNLLNSEDDRVKTVFYPVYLTGADGLLDLNYYETIIGSHLGFFPSTYEPWGYTPLESAALGVAAVTTDVSGFGMAIKKIRPPHVREAESCVVEEEEGIFIARAMGKSRDYIIQELFAIMSYYSSLEQEDRAELKMEARRIASFYDWNKIFVNYIKAHNFAINKKVS